LTIAAPAAQTEPMFSGLLPAGKANRKRLSEVGETMERPKAAALPRRQALIGGAALLTPALATPARAQEWPARPIRFIVPFPAGGSTDVLGRLLAEMLRDGLGQPVVVENRAGAGGNIGVDAIAKAAPDGYTMGVSAGGALAINVSLFRRLPYDPRRDHEPIAQIARTANILVVRSQSPIRSLPELIAAARARPGELSYATPGVGSSSHLSGELLRVRAGIDIFPVHFGGNAPSATAMMRGDVAFTFETMTTGLAAIRAGQFRALAVTGAARAPALPDVPTMAEAGVPDCVTDVFFAVIGPAGMPRAAVERTSAALQRGLRAPGVEERFRDTLGLEIAFSSPEELRGIIASEIDRWGEIVRISGARAD